MLNSLLTCRSTSILFGTIFITNSMGNRFMRFMHVKCEDLFSVFDWKIKQIRQRNVLNSHSWWNGLANILFLWKRAEIKAQNIIALLRGTNRISCRPWIIIMDFKQIFNFLENIATPKSHMLLVNFYCFKLRLL